MHMANDKPRVHGLGGVFFKAKDPAALGAWYRDKLGFEVDPSFGGAMFQWNRRDREQVGMTLWSPFAADTQYMAPSDKPYMINLRVDDLDAMLASLRADGCQVLDRREDGDYGRFGYVLDPEGTLLELWQAPEVDPGAAPA
jgi:predicted enzyme related to lactoylglutathione lyase